MEMTTRRHRVEVRHEAIKETLETTDYLLFLQLAGGAGGENYVPEDLISLLDAGINSDHPSVIIDADAMFSEEMFSYSGQARQATLARSSSSR